MKEKIDTVFATWILDNWKPLLKILREVERSENEREIRRQKFIEMTKKFKLSQLERKG
jgi:hypothetical protein